MGEYFRDSHNRIQADFALHAKRLLLQYNFLTADHPPSDRYEATLAVCILQTLLTNCSELLKTMKDNRTTDFETDFPDKWGLTDLLIVDNNFPGALTVESVVDHLRDALSHPTVSKRTRPTPTGYTTIPDASKHVSAFLFTDSPWVKKGAIMDEYSPSTERAVKAGIARFERTHNAKGYLEALPQGDGTFFIALDGVPYHPLFVIRLPLDVLVDFAIQLANYLAQATNERDWDGNSILQVA